MTTEEMEVLSLVELRDCKQKLSGKITSLNRKMQKRKQYLKDARYPGYEPNIKGDAELLQMKEEMVGLVSEMSHLKEYIKLRNCRVSVETERAAFERRKIALEQAQFEAENKDFINGRNAKAEERRPGGPAVWFGPEFNNIKGAEKRLIVMMAREIGQNRYNELRRIAYWDHRNGNNRYYTGSAQWNDRKGLF